MSRSSRPSGARVTGRVGRLAALPLLWALAGGCATQPLNPSFPVTLDAAKRDLRRMSADPKPLEMPLVVISGLLDPGVGALTMESDFRLISKRPRIAAISLFDCTSFEQCRRKIVDVVGRAFPFDSPRETAEVDVIGYSLGGVAARLAANPPGNQRRLHIHRLFTIDSPHQGADRASQLPLLHPLQADLRAGSALLVRLNATPPDFPVFAYVRLNDKPVGPANAAVPGQPLWWVPTPPMSNPHMGAY
ncbi:MAG TPA: hypothetical protein VLJ39_02720, partial [Tepidisphaeraceae bacterium]|nr:hypothetical protein [Tepidisphaeraceae bacterium]